MKEYYVRFNWETKNVDVFRRVDDLLIGSSRIVNGIVDTLDLRRIAHALNIEGDKEISNLEYRIFYEDRYWREQEEEQMKAYLN